MKQFFFIVLLFCTNLSYAQTRNLKLVKAPIENPTNEKRKAVVIGMSDYGSGKSLNNTLNDADDMANVLTQLGFEVTLLKNNDLRNLETNLTNWYNTIERNDMAVFYFAGHGVEVSGRNYLIPIEAELNSEVDVRYNALSVNKVLDNMDLKQIRFKLLILDACRDNPFTREWNRSISEKGLAQMRAPKGTLIAFAAAPGATAQDGGTYNLLNGVFTYYLKQEIVKEGASIDNILNRVAGNVSNLTNDQQLPYKSGILTDDFYFIPPSNNKPSPTPEVINKRHPAEPEMVFVQGGIFTMGAPGHDLHSPHQVTISSFNISKYLITQKQWLEVMDISIKQLDEKSVARKEFGDKEPPMVEGDNYPVYYVSWELAQEFIRRLNIATGKNYRLPTDAEWEYAARGGIKSRGYKYPGSDNIEDVMVIGVIAPVAQKQPNELGLYDMRSYVHEWCYDFFVYNLGTSPQTDPIIGPNKDGNPGHVVRGIGEVWERVWEELRTGRGFRLVHP